MTARQSGTARPSGTARQSGTQLPQARREYLLREVQLRGTVRAAAAAADLGVTEVTVRRDIIELERAGRLVRVHGGAIALPTAAGPQAASVLVGVMVPAASAHFALILRGMEAAAGALHARVVLAESHYRPDVERAHVERLLELGVQGLVLSPTVRGWSEPELADWARRLPAPTVFLDRRIDETTSLAEFDGVRTDHARGAMLAVEHLAALGHERIALALYEGTPTAPLIAEGYRRGMDHLGLTPEPALSLPKGLDDELDVAVEALLDGCALERIRAVLVHTDYHASRVIEKALDRGMRIPDDLAIVAYDDENAQLAIVPLTSVTPPKRELGRLALQLAVDRIGERDDEHRSPRQVQLLPRLTIRRSCGAIRDA